MHGDNPILPLLDPKLLSQLTEAEIKSISWLDDIIQNSDSVEHIGGGILLARKKNAEARLNFLQSLNMWLSGDFHLAITVQPKNFPHERDHPCVEYGRIPFGVYCATWVLIAGAGWPEEKYSNGDEATPATLTQSFEWANRLFEEYDGTPVALAAAREAERAEAQRQAILAERAEAQRLVALQAERKERLMIEQIIQARQFAKFCAGDLVDLTNASYAKDFWEAAYSDSMEGINFTNDLLMRGVSAAAECINSGFNTGDVIDAIRFFLDRFSPLTINANLRSLANNGPEARILRLYKC